MVLDGFLYACVIAFIAAIVLGILWMTRHAIRSRLKFILNLLLGATALAGAIWTMPLFFAPAGNPAEKFFSGLTGVLQMFSLDADFAQLRQLVRCSSESMTTAYLFIGSILYFLGPILTVGFVLSLFQNLFTWFILKISAFRTVYIFSSLNEQSLALAKSCKAHAKQQGERCRIVFCCIQETTPLQDEAATLHPILTKLAPTSPQFSTHFKKRIFFALSENEDNNLTLALDLIELYKQQEDTSLYCFTSSQESALLIGTTIDHTIKMHIRRVNQIQSLVYHYMYENNLFSYAIEEPDGTKRISIAIVGMGQHGTEFLKAATWCGQLPGYDLHIHIFDSDPAVEDRFTAQCPELMEFNHSDIDGEAHYHIWFHHGSDGGGVNVHSPAFHTLLEENGPYTLAIVSLGSDEVNLETAVELRRSFTRTQPDFAPRIEAVIYQPNKANTLRSFGLTDYKGRDYDIHIIGDLETTYSYESVMLDELEDEARHRHLAWTDRDNPEAVASDTRKFYKYEYFYRSSLASVIRRKIRADLGIPGTEKPVKERTREERVGIQRMEHAGWCAYMRTEGFRYSPVRNDLARLHNDLVPFDQLSVAEQEKDDD